MTRCPNCGSAIRIGAKFCTSCGFRLTVDEPAAASAVVPSRSPFSTTSTPAWSAGPAETSAPIAATVVTPEDEVEPAWSKVDDDSPDPDVRADAAGKDVGSSVPATSDRVGGTVGADTDAWETPARDDQPEPSWFSPPAQDTSGPVSDDMIATLGDEPADRLRADTISAVLTDRDLLLAALRGDEAGVEETWAAEDDEPSTYPAWRALP